MRGLTEGDWCPWLAALLDVHLIPGECSGGPRLESLLWPLVREKAGTRRAGRVWARGALGLGVAAS